MEKIDFIAHSPSSVNSLELIIDTLKKERKGKKRKEKKRKEKLKEEKNEIKKLFKSNPSML